MDRPSGPKKSDPQRDTRRSLPLAELLGTSPNTVSVTLHKKRSKSK